MMEKMNLEEILANNPKIEAEMLDELRELRGKLAEYGFAATGYNLSSPFERRRPSESSGKTDPRAVHVGRSYRK